MLFIFNSILGAVGVGTYYIAKKMHNEKKHGKMTLCILAGIVIFSIIFIIKEEWQIQIRTNYGISSSPSQSVTSSITTNSEQENFNPFDSNNNPSAPTKIIDKNIKKSQNIFQSREHQFSIAIPNGWMPADLNPSYPSMILDAYSPSNNEMKVTILQPKSMSNSSTFENISAKNRNAFITGMFEGLRKKATDFNIDVQYVGDGDMKVNGETALWLTTRQSGQNFQQQSYCYFIAKNKRIYMISYFINGESSRQPQAKEVIESLHSFKLLSNYPPGDML